ncbi:uncharacterized protein LTR77_004464 [Saxophila tyrrhenica]|uniref:Arrestin-like N-terminal domain-containing protein n=1 Tax=Saxophila tyrrhenica TaxID=1690608 RepID=A0AAV9PH64_9PEZI|nr:hypothetical protein LTR77_004464 [Saxophila tyrrhenica]
MAAAIVLDQPGNVSYTNLDQISGKVVVRCGKSIDVESIVVKVEGESRTRLLAPPGPSGERAKPQLEYHKILYKTQVVFPRPDILEGSWTTSKNSFTLPPGNHEYPFSVKLPFNNSCASDKSQMGTMSISGSGIEVSKPPQTHVKKTLPPTLSGFPGEAEIRYFVKATVRRSSFWKENPRAYAPFNFFPIEPPRPSPSGNEIYARQKHAFAAFPEGQSAAKAKMKSIFSKSKEPPLTSATSNEAPSISVDARLPESSILTCNDDIPLRLIVKKLNDSDAVVNLQSLEVSLIGQTKIRAHDLHTTESNSWVIVSRSNMGMPIGTASDSAGTENAIADNLWRGQTLPNTIAPSFETCNISRKYQLDVRIGLSYSGAMQSSAKPQTIILPLRLDVTVFSGIAPPSQLLEAMAQARVNKPKPTINTTTALDEKLKVEKGKRNSMTVPETPMEGPSRDLPARQGTAVPPQPPVYDDAPPSYEDAIATDLPPVNVPRPNYAPPPPTEDDVLLSDEKKGLRGRRDS